MGQTDRARPTVSTGSPAGRLAALFCVFALVLLGCRKGEGHACARNECAIGMVCENGTCVTCAKSEACRSEKRCTWDEDAGECLRAKPKVRETNDDKEGCPCGCDHSEALVAELAARDRVDALDGVRRSLRTIVEREQTGYVTDAMVAHRLRLRALERDLVGVDGALFSAPLTSRAALLRAERARQIPYEADGLAIQRELLVFGATTDIVDGKPKELKACFRLWLQITNLTSVGTTLGTPALSTDSGPELEVQRWYVEDDDGEPWSGALLGGETVSVLVIGYLSEQTPPGGRLDVRTRVAGVELEDATVTLDHWDAHARALDPRNESP